MHSGLWFEIDIKVLLKDTDCSDDTQVRRIVGQAEKFLTVLARDESNQLQVWNSGQVAHRLFPEKGGDRSKIRQTYRVLERARVVPDALSVDGLMAQIQCGPCRELVRQAVTESRSSRNPVAIVQLREVRLGTFAVVWNNLRLARRWMWFDHTAAKGQLDAQIASQLMCAHSAPCLLLFHSSAYRLRDVLMDHPSFVVQEIKSCGAALKVLERLNDLRAEL